MRQMINGLLAMNPEFYLKIVGSILAVFTTFLAWRERASIFQRSKYEEEGKAFDHGLREFPQEELLAKVLRHQKKRAYLRSLFRLNLRDEQWVAVISYLDETGADINDVRKGWHYHKMRDGRLSFRLDAGGWLAFLFPRAALLTLLILFNVAMVYSLVQNDEDAFASALVALAFIPVVFLPLIFETAERAVFRLRDAQKRVDRARNADLDNAAKPRREFIARFLTFAAHLRTLGGYRHLALRVAKWSVLAACVWFAWQLLSGFRV